jgi:hypothetical protein
MFPAEDRTSLGELYCTRIKGPFHLAPLSAAQLDPRALTVLLLGALNSQAAHKITFFPYRPEAEYYEYSEETDCTVTEYYDNIEETDRPLAEYYDNIEETDCPVAECYDNTEETDCPVAEYYDNTEETDCPLAEYYDDLEITLEELHIIFACDIFEIKAAEMALSGVN